MNSEDGGGFVSGPAGADVAVVLTDIRGITGGTDNPWGLYTAVTAEAPTVAPVPNGVATGPFTMTLANLPVEPGSGSAPSGPPVRICLLTGGPFFAFPVLLGPGFA